MFKAFGHDNVAVLDGGLPEWVKQGYKTEGKQQTQYSKGNFKAEYHKESMLFFEDTLLKI